MSHQIPKECERFRELLPEQAEGRLAGRERARVERHLADCPRCSAEVEDLRAVIQSVRAVPTAEVPEDLIPRVRRAVHDTVPAPAVPSLPWARLAIPVAVLMAVVGITFALKGTNNNLSVPQAVLIDPATGKPLRSQGNERSQVIQRSDEQEQLQVASKPAEGVSGPAATATPAAEERKSSSAGIVPSVPNVSISGRLGAEGEAPAAQTEASASAEDRATEPATLAPPPFRAARKASGSAGARGGGGMRGGGGAGGGRGGVGAGEHMYGQAAEPARERAPDLRGAADRVEGPAPPIGATVAVADSRGGKMLALKLFSETPVQDISLSLGQGPPRSYEWQGPSARPAWIPLTQEQLGPGPTQIPVRLEAGSLKRSYVLFLPVMSRLGESAASAPVIRYDARPISSVLADLTALSGLIVLAESPLDATVSGQSPSGTPAEALTWVAGETGFDIHSESGLAYTLTHSR